jgi:uncharacterized protein
MKLGVIADTHMPIKGQSLPEELSLHFKDVDLILHAGDILNLSVIDQLEKIAPVRAVYGNMDREETRKKLPRKDIIEIGGFRIGLIHSLGRPWQMLKKVKEEFPRVKLDVVVYGHSHMPAREIKKGILFFNPGCPMRDIFCPYRSIGLLILSDRIESKILKLKK